MSYLDDFIEKLNNMPQQVISSLRTIRELDKQVEIVKYTLQKQKEQFFQTLEKWQHKKIQKDKEKADNLYKQINRNYQQISDLSKQKVQLADKLYNIVHQPTERLDKELHIRTRQRNVKGEELKSKKKKTRKFLKGFVRDIRQADPAEPVYCFCGKQSYGEMVMCQNTYCQRQWFHVDCIGQTINPAEKWYCRQCRKNKQGENIRTKTRRGKK